MGRPRLRADAPGSSQVEILLTADGDETVVNLSHTGLPAEKRATHLDGWTEHLDLLQALLEPRNH
jgi:uncharacterized protein YndB with AHSA1/START domain